jgi:hypothetical protein
MANGVRRQMKCRRGSQTAATSALPALQDSVRADAGGADIGLYVCDPWFLNSLKGMHTERAVYGAPGKRVATARFVCRGLFLRPDTPPAIARSQSGWGSPPPPPYPRQSCCSSTSANPQAVVPALFAPGSDVCTASVVGTLSHDVQNDLRTGAARRAPGAAAGDSRSVPQAT